MAGHLNALECSRMQYGRPLCIKATRRRDGWFVFNEFRRAVRTVDKHSGYVVGRPKWWWYCCLMVGGWGIYRKIKYREIVRWNNRRTTATTDSSSRLGSLALFSMPVPKGARPRAIQHLKIFPVLTPQFVYAVYTHSCTKRRATQKCKLLLISTAVLCRQLME